MEEDEPPPRRESGDEGDPEGFIEVDIDRGEKIHKHSF